MGSNPSPGDFAMPSAGGGVERVVGGHSRGGQGAFLGRGRMDPEVNQAWEGGQDRSWQRWSNPNTYSWPDRLYSGHTVLHQQNCWCRSEKPQRGAGVTWGKEKGCSPAVLCLALDAVQATWDWAAHLFAMPSNPSFLYCCLFYSLISWFRMISGDGGLVTLCWVFSSSPRSALKP